MKPIRNLIAVTAVVAAFLSLAAGPAVAKHKGQEFSYYATIDCGRGPIQVGSGEDLWSPLVDLKTGRAANPVAWDVTFPGGSLAETKEGASAKRTVVCSYTDGVATGTVTLDRKKCGRGRADD